MYQSIDALPAEIRNEYPRQACELYRAAYNRILEKETAGTQSGGTEKDTRTAAEKAHEAAVLAVRSEFEKDSAGVWHRSPIGSEMQPASDPVDGE
jgi:cation transport regulator ChaB